ncbi:MAG TPA: hypothetical protein VHT02_06685 [Methylocella sp.]|nr:hypothetical protein [Methylocella sp.]
MKQRKLECLDKAIYPTSARKRNFKRNACCALLAATVITVPGIASAERFFKLNNPGDLSFNQLLGINNQKIIAGYFGDGTVVVNNGYVLVPNTHYSVENFAGTPPAGHTITQTQAIGINNSEVPVIVGFWADQNGLQFGWDDIKGVFTTVLDPNATAGSGNQNLLGVNESNKAAGFWTDSAGNEHGFVVNLAITPPSFTEIPPKLFNGAVATQASGITDNNIVCGFWADKNGIDHGFFGPLGSPTNSFQVTINGVVAKSTQALGCSNKFIVGSYVDFNGKTHGFIFDGKTFTQFNAPGSSQTAAFGVAGTIINGVNDEGDIVGFFSDGTNVNGFVQFVNPVGPQ